MAPSKLTDEELLTALKGSEPFGISKLQRLSGWSYNQAARKIEDWLGRSKITATDSAPWCFNVCTMEEPQP